MNEKLIGIREAARKIGIAHSTLSRQVTRAQVRSHGGKVKLSEVIHDRKHNLDQSIWLGRKRSTKPKIGASGATSRNGAAVHGADPDDGAAHAPEYWEFAPAEVIGLGGVLNVREDLRNDPAVVGSVMALAGSELILAELHKLGWRPGGDPRAAADDADPIGPRPFVNFQGDPLDMGLVRRFGRAITPADPDEPIIDPNDPVAVAEGLLLLAVDIFGEEIKRLKALAVENNS
jgi:hypothetical protein